MNRLDRPATSEVLKRKLKYNSNSKNADLKEILRQEQRNYCAYTQARFTPTHLQELDHFNPTLKGTEQDGYSNWFLINSRWNRIKGDKRRWRKYQPLLHPTSADLDGRIIYEKGFYKADPNDNDAQNFIDYLVLNQSELVKDRIEL